MSTMSFLPARAAGTMIGRRSSTIVISARNPRVCSYPGGSTLRHGLLFKEPMTTMVVRSFRSTTSTKKLPSTRTANTTTSSSSLRRRRKSRFLSSNSASGASSNSSSSSGASAGAGSSGTTMTSRLNQLNEILLAPRVFRVPRWISPKHFSITLSEVFGHLSFCLVFCSYAVDDFLMLRMIAVAGSSAILVFSYFHPHGRPLWLPFKWNALFIAVNCYRIGVVLWDEYRAKSLKDEYHKLHHDHFHIVDLVDFAKLIKLGEVETFQPGDVVIRQGEWNPYLRLVMEGELDVFRDGHRTYSLEEGNFISEVGLHAGLKLTGPVESSATVATKKDSRGHVRCMKFDRTKLIELLQKETNLNRSFQHVLGWDIVSKLKHQRTLLMRSNTLRQKSGESAEDVIAHRQDQNLHRYFYILHNALLQSSGDIRAMKDDLDSYRSIHHISEQDHLKALTQLGWTIEEYNQGYQKGRLSTKKSIFQRDRNIMLMKED